MRRLWLMGAIALAAPSSGARAADCAPGHGAPVAVSAVSRLGDLRLSDGRTLRLAGLDWPGRERSRDRDRLAAYVEALVLHAGIETGDASAPDRWGRAAAQVFIRRADGRLDWVQGDLAEEGMAVAWPEPAAAACWAALLERENLARLERAGVWAALSARPSGGLRAAVRAGNSRRVVFEGQVRSVRKGRSVTFVNFFGARATTPSWFLGRKLADELARRGRDFATVSGKRLRLRAERIETPTPRLTVATVDGVEILE